MQRQTNPPNRADFLIQKKGHALGARPFAMAWWKPLVASAEAHRQLAAQPLLPEGREANHLADLADALRRSAVMIIAVGPRVPDDPRIAIHLGQNSRSCNREQIWYS